ncbi:MAG TPA: dihydrolipoyl dehydrogenase [Candidatus Limnocylindria bacterium]|nr:dihydrolipoyl dehydrogenase [Candidatus Limnocylindria bacterium]
MTGQYDIAILGGGPGGYVAALYAGLKGAKVALVERDRVGGTCVTVGCIPSKALLDSSHAYWLATHGEEHGIAVQGARFDLAKSVARKERVVDTLVGGIETLLKARKVDLITADGTLVSPTEIRAKGKDGERTLKAKSVIVATGSKVGVPPIKGLAEAKPLDNVGALALREIPKRLVVIGGGVIGLELATFYAEIGSQVTVLEMLPQPIAFADPELVRVLLRSLEPRGVKVLTGAKVTSVKRTAKTVTVTAEVEGKEQAFEGDEVLLGAGRIANLSGVEQAGLATSRLGITVDERMRTNVKGVWAIGDCIGDERSPKLAHVASTQGEVAVDVILGEKDARMDYDVVPNVVYTHPEVAQVGLTEAQAKEKHGDAVKVSRFPFRASGRALALGESDGLVKLVTAGAEQRVVGVHVVGPQASELVATAALAVRLEATTYDLVHTITAHPTLSEAIREAALSAMGTPIHTAR